jgi:hypothetical protein
LFLKIPTREDCRTDGAAVETVRRRWRNGEDRKEGSFIYAGRHREGEE